RPPTRNSPTHAPATTKPRPYRLIASPSSFRSRYAATLRNEVVERGAATDTPPTVPIGRTPRTPPSHAHRRPLVGALVLERPGKVQIRPPVVLDLVRSRNESVNRRPLGMSKPPRRK